MDYATLKVETRGAIDLLTLNRPAALNASRSRIDSQLITVPPCAGFICDVLTTSHFVFEGSIKAPSIAKKAVASAISGKLDRSGYA